MEKGEKSSGSSSMLCGEEVRSRVLWERDLKVKIMGVATSAIQY
jgi:hypothetical protein